MALFRRKPPREPQGPVIRRMRELEIVTARLIRNGFAGQYHAAFHGRGIEFSQVREYQPGDDIRTIDWNVTARSGVPHVKEFIEERDLTVIIAVDVSPSMRFGSVDRRKIDLAIELTAVLGFAALQNNDRAGLLLYDDSIRRFVPPGRGRVHVQRLVREALVATTIKGSAADLSRAAAFLGKTSTKRAVIIFISDFLDRAPSEALDRLNLRHDVIAIEVGDPREQRFPQTGLITLVDSETGQRQLVDLRKNDLVRIMSARSRGLTDQFRRGGIDRLTLSTAVPYERDLLRFFERRIARHS